MPFLMVETSSKSFTNFLRGNFFDDDLFSDLDNSRCWIIDYVWAEEQVFSAAHLRLPFVTFAFQLWLTGNTSDFTSAVY